MATASVISSTQGCQHLQIKMREIPEGEMAEGHDAGERVQEGAAIVR